MLLFLEWNEKGASEVSTVEEANVSAHLRCFMAPDAAASGMEEAAKCFCVDFGVESLVSRQGKLVPPREPQSAWPAAKATIFLAVQNARQKSLSLC